MAKLVDAGLMARGQLSDDRRQIPLELTEAGSAVAGELTEHSKPFFDQMTGALGDDLEQVIAALDKLARASAIVRETGEPEDLKGA